MNLIALLVVDFFTAVTLLLVAVWCLEVLVAILPWKETTQVEPLSRLRFAVLVPVHNAQSSIGRTVQALLPTLGAKDRLLVVAENCTDNTASIARRAGAEVIEHADGAHRGIAHAIDAGLKHLKSDPPDAVVFLRNGTQARGDTVRLLGTAAMTMRRPAQAIHDPPLDSGTDSAATIANLKLRFKHLVRALGLARMTGVTHLASEGMALPWALTYNLRDPGETPVDYRQLGLDLAVAGTPPLLVPSASVERAASDREHAAESGYLKSLVTKVPWLLFQGAIRCRPDVIGLGLDLAVPSLATLFRLWILALIFALAGVPMGTTAWPALVLLLAGGCVALIAATAWFVHCRKVVRLRALLAVPFYLLGRSAPAAVLDEADAAESAWQPARR